MAEQELKIRISVEDNGASQKLAGVKNNLKDINESVGKLQNKGQGLPALNRQLGEFARVLNDLSKVNGSNIYALGKNVNHMLVTLGRLDVSKYSANIDQTTAQLGKMAQTFSSFATDGNKMEKGVEGLEKLPRAFRALDDLPKEKLENLAQIMATLAAYTAKAAKNGSGINALATGLSNLPGALRGFGTAASYEGKIEQVKETLKKFGDMSVKGGASFESVASGIKKLPEALREFGEAKNYAGGIKQVAIALQALEPAVSGIYKYGNGIGSLADGLSKLPGALAGFKTETDYSPNIKKLGEVLEELTQAVQVADTEATKGFRSLANAVGSIRRSAGDDDLEEKLRRLAEQIKKFIESLDGITDDQARKIYNLGVELKGIVDASRGLEKAKENLSKMSGVTKYADIGKNALRAFGNELKKLPGRVLKVVKTLGKLFALPLKPFINGLAELKQRITGFLHSIGGIALYRAIRSGLKMITSGAKEGIDNLYKWAQVVGNDFAPTMDHLASEFLYLKNSVGAAISPIIQMVEPVITALIRKFIELLNVFNQFVSIVAGRDTFRRAIYYATTYGDQLEDSMDGAGKSAKELQNILMDFDQLNLIETPKDRNRADDNDEEDWALMFEEVPVDASLFGWLDNVDWSGIGKKFSDKIASMLNSINWANIKKKTKDLASKFASFLNGIFGNTTMFTALGTTVAEGLNTVTLAINTFVNETDWEQLGHNLAEMLKTMVKKIDAEELGKAIFAGARIISGIIIGFAENMSKKDWEEVADAVYKAVSSAVKSIDWKRLIPSLVELTTGLIQAITAAIRGIATSINEIKKGVASADWKGFRQALGDLLLSLCYDIPVIPIILKLSIAKIIFDAGKAAIGKMLTEAVAKAVGGSVTGAGAEGIGVVSVGMNFLFNAGIAIQVAEIFETAQTVANLTATDKALEDYDAILQDLVDKGFITQRRKDDYIMEAEIGRFYGKSDWSKEIDALLEYYNEWKTTHENIQTEYHNHVDTILADRQREHQAFVNDLESQLGGALTKIDDFYKAGLLNEQSYTHLVQMYLDGNIDGINRALGAASSAQRKDVDNAKKSLKEMLSDGKITISDYQRLLNNLTSSSKTTVSGAIKEINDLFNNLSGNLSGVKNNAYTWGTDICKNLASGLNNNIKLVSQAAINIAKGIDENLAFSEPDKGPLSDFHTYMPDMINLMVQGIRENQYKVENAAVGLASTISSIGSMATDPSLYKQNSGTAQDMASDIYNANAEERALLRELISAVREQRLTISPSASLGKVVSQSQRLYAGVTG